MKLKQALAGVASLFALSAAHAQSANTFYFTTGWFHFAPLDSSDPLKVDSVNGSPVPASLGTQANTGAGVGNADTVALSFGYFVTDNIAVEAELGIPPNFDLSGKGQYASYGKIGKARLWAPAMLFKYYFNKADAKFRPYAGIGFTYTWFTNAKITNGAFESEVLGSPNSISTTNSWAPVFNVGFNYNFTKHWFAGFSLSYVPVSVIAKFDTTVDMPPLGNVNRVSEAKIHLNPLITYLKVGYMF